MLIVTIVPTVRQFGINWWMIVGARGSQWIAG